MRLWIATLENSHASRGDLMSALPISTFDGYALGTFTETDTQQTDTYSNKIIPLWYGKVIERSNDRTEFVTWRDMIFDTLKESIYIRINGILTAEEFAKRPATFQETEYKNPFRATERTETNANILGAMPIDVSGNYHVMASINEYALVTSINRYAYNAPPEVKLQAAVEYAVWQIRQPPQSNRANGFVRSGAATYLDPFKYRSI